ncbi:MAG: hypothetical protein Ta2D_05470 [Rickettsiales bacterium]|nr:MAG: hypothetical protein Ta2D_05470 [Rickettsiales bacterium]
MSKNVESNLKELLLKECNRVYAVGIKKENNKFANIPDHSDANRGKKTTKGGFQANYVKKKANITLKELFKTLSKKYQIESNIDMTGKNKDVIEIINLLMKQITQNKKDKTTEKQIENGYLALLINSIRDMKFGKNAYNTEKQKGFNMPLVDTGTLINNLTAWRLENGNT